MTTANLDDLRTVLAGMAKAVEPVVLRIEGGPQVTKYHYAEYMTAIARLSTVDNPKPTNGFKLAVGVALVKAGANRHGVEAALKLMGVL